MPQISPISLLPMPQIYHTEFDLREPMDPALSRKLVAKNVDAHLSPFGHEWHGSTAIDHIVTANGVEHQRRHAFLERFRLDVGHRAIISTTQLDPDKIPRDALLAFCDIMRGDSRPSVTCINGNAKGVSEEIGYVDQFGSWAVAKDLDLAIRALAQNGKLQKTGIEISKTYDSLDSLQSYRFHIADAGNDNNADADKRVIIANRLRPVADLRVDGVVDPLHIIKRSSFVVIDGMVDLGVSPLLDDALNNPNDKARHSIAGKSIIEPEIMQYRNQGKIIDSPVFPVQSLYFVMHRHRYPA